MKKNLRMSLKKNLHLVLKLVSLDDCILHFLNFFSDQNGIQRANYG